MATRKELEEEINKIKLRNKKVEADKAWETSKTRTAFIAFVTFTLVYFFTVISGGDMALLNAIFAVTGYWISTETYNVLKNWWLKRRD